MSLISVATAIMSKHGLLQGFNIDEEKFEKWLVEIAKGYDNMLLFNDACRYDAQNPYHNATHAAV